MVLKHQSSQAVLWLRTATQWPAPDRALHCLTYGAGSYFKILLLVQTKTVSLCEEGRQRGGALLATTEPLGLQRSAVRPSVYGGGSSCVQE